MRKFVSGCNSIGISILASDVGKTDCAPNQDLKHQVDVFRRVTEKSKTLVYGPFSWSADERNHLQGTG